MELKTFKVVLYLNCNYRSISVNNTVNVRLRRGVLVRAKLVKNISFLHDQGYK